MAPVFFNSNTIGKTSEEREQALDRLRQAMKDIPSLRELNERLQTVKPNDPLRIQLSSEGNSAASTMGCMIVPIGGSR